MLISYFWIILIVFDALCVLVASVFILMLAHAEDRRRKKGMYGMMRARATALQSEVNSLRKELNSLREALETKRD